MSKDGLGLGGQATTEGSGREGAELVDQRTQAVLRERVKELTCLYGIARLAGKPDASLEEILHGIAELLQRGSGSQTSAAKRVVGPAFAEEKALCTHVNEGDSER